MNDKIKNVVVSLLFSGFIVITLFLNILLKDKGISVSERRKLEQLPNLSIKSVISGNFFSKFDTYASDQFVFRDNIREEKVKLDLLVKNNYHNIYQYNGYLIERIYSINIASIDNWTKKINEIYNKYLEKSNVYLSIIPDKNYFVSNNNLKMDYDFITSRIMNNLGSIKYIDIFNDLTLEDYYYSDSHWKQENIIEIANKLLMEMDSYNNFRNYSVEDLNSFKGIYSYQVPVKVKEDRIKLVKNYDIENSKVYNNITGKYSKIYDESKYNSMDLYDVYLSGAQGLLTISNNNASNDKELIVFRDSYGSSLIPLFVSSYKKIILIDTRYIPASLLDTYIKFSEQDVLFLYSILTINNSYTLR